MRKLILAAMFAASPAFADLIARNGENELRLIHAPCTHAGILGQLKPEWRAKFSKAQAMVGGKMFYACFIDTGEGVYWVQYEDGTSAGYPVSAFLDVPGV